MIRKSLHALLILFLASSAVCAQDMVKAGKLLQLKAYPLAQKNYEQIIADDPANAEAHAQLAEVYRLTNHPMDAIELYEKAFALSDDLDAHYLLNYAHTLKKVGLYQQASSWYASYMTADAAMADYYIQSNEFAKNLLQEKAAFDVLAFEGNTEDADFAPSFFNGKMIFSSFHQDNENKLNSSHIQNSASHLYIVDLEDMKTEYMRDEEDREGNISSLSYSKDGGMVAFMKHNFSNNSMHIFSDETDLSIYYAMTNAAGEIQEIKPFPYNEVSYSYAFPSLGFDGNAMYFASNRPGGFGGFDIYVSYFKDGQWSVPENLGASINSPGDEITPFFDGERLLFASNYHFGLGGYDIFESKVVEGEWMKSVNMGKGVNSPSDDYFPSYDAQNDRIVLTSNRLGGQGRDDIYFAYDMAQSPVKKTDITYEDVPEAIDLEALKEVNAPDSEGLVEAAESQSSQPRVVEVADEEVVVLAKDFDFEGATFDKISTVVEALPNEAVYFIQLAAYTRSEGNKANFADVQGYGDLYRFFKPGNVKIRLGYYNTRQEAETVLGNVRNMGHADAFVVTDVLSVANYELMRSSGGSFSPVIGIHDESSYKVKLASYKDPLQFNVEAIKDVGRLEQWSKGEWTIFVLGGFKDIEAAKRARITAINRGWAEAELVSDEDGILRRVGEN